MFADGKWRKAAAAPRPRDLRYRFDDHGFDVELAVVFDRTLDRVLRVGYEELAVLDGETWRVLTLDTLRDFTKRRDVPVAIHVSRRSARVNSNRRGGLSRHR